MNAKLTLFFLFTAAYSNITAQPQLKIQKEAGGKNDDFFSCMALTRDSGVIAGGTSYSGISGEKTDTLRGTNKHNGDYWIVKYDKTGKIEWDKTIGGTGDDQLLSIQQTKDKGYILGGYSGSYASADKTAPRIGTVDFWLVKLDKAGNIEWDKTYGNFENVYTLCWLTDVKQTKDNGYILTGNAFNTSEDYDSPSLTIKTDAAGNMQWHVFTVGEKLLTTRIQQTRDSGYIMGASSVDHYNEESSYTLTKLDKYGSIKWTKSYGDQVFMQASLNAIEELADGYLLAGNYDGYIDADKSENSRGGQDYWLLKVDTAGNRLSDKTIGGSDNDYLRSVDKTYDGGIILGGYSASNASGEKSENNNGGGGSQDYDYWIVKLDAAGNIQWDKTVGGDGSDLLFAIKERKPGQFITGGYSYSGISGDKTKSSRGGADYWLVNVVYNAAVAALQNKPENITACKINKGYIIYPNPVKDLLHIQNTGKATFSLINQSGKQILTKTINGNGEINVSYLPAGLYYLKNGETGAVQKIMITK